MELSRNRAIKIFLFIIVIFFSNIFIIKNAFLNKEYVMLEIEAKSEIEGDFQLFVPDNGKWTEESSQKISYLTPGEKKKLEFKIPYGIDKVRFDLIANTKNTMLDNIDIKFFYKSWSLRYNKEISISETNQVKYDYKNNKLIIEANGNDPYLTLEITKDLFSSSIDPWYDLINIVLRGLICLFVDILLLLVAVKSKSVVGLMVELFNSRSLIWNLAKNDFKTKYAGSYLGIIWAFIQPVVTILLYWFVFGFGLKAGSPIKDVPFILWFITGLVPWFFFQEGIMNATTCMMEYSYLVKKVVFKISVLPIIKIISALFIHVVFVIFLMVVAISYKVKFGIITFQLIYYSFCTFILMLGISYATSAIVLFFKDLTQIISIFLQIGMWMTPIIWSYTIIPEKYQWIAKLNPMFYIVEGYRDTLLNHVWFWDRYYQTALFWVITLICFGAGALIFKKLKPHFSDVL